MYVGWMRVPSGCRSQGFHQLKTLHVCELKVLYSTVVNIAFSISGDIWEVEGPLSTGSLANRQAHSPT